MSELRKITRREFLKNTGQMSGGLVFALTFSSACETNTIPFGLADKANKNVSPNVYVNIRDDGIVEIMCHRSEMGQGIRTSLPQIVADELDADWDKIKVIQAIGHELYGDQNTDGSTSIRKHFDLLRNAGATARDMMIAAASVMWSVPEKECITREHAVHHLNTNKSVGYGELVDIAAGLPQPKKATFKSPEDYRYIGKAVDTIDGRAFTTGQAKYGVDTVLPNMLYVSIERCPVVGGTVKSFDDKATKAVTGVVSVIKMPNPTSPPLFNIKGGIAVVATNTWSAFEGRKALKIKWNFGENEEHESVSYKEKLIASASAPGTTVLKRGDADIKAQSQHEALYYTPYLAHAPMEPPAAAAVFNEDGTCEVWASSQDPQTARATVASTLGIDKEKIKMNVTLLGGGFGRKSKPDFVAEAAWLAREIRQPVMVAWSREDDIRHGYFHSVAAQYFRAGIGEDGTTQSWLHRSSFPSIFSTFAPNVNGPSGFELDLGILDAPWNVPNMRIETCEAKAHLRIGWLRSVCNVFHAFGACGFVDELAYVKGLDPKVHLLEMIGPARKIDLSDNEKYSNYGHDLSEHPIDTGRLSRVAEKVAEMAEWGRKLPDGHGLGIAVHRSFVSYVGAVAEVSVNNKGALIVHKLWMAIDAGVVINTDRVHSQLEGAGIFGMSLALHGELTAKNGAILEGNFDSYPMARMNEGPDEIHTYIIESDEAPGGVGEPGVPPVAPAIVNAYFAASGKRIRELPLRNAGLV
ncbi:MAG: hypothetical protein CMQ54_03375 [Gammaproteobacteria bacterium]|nr:hypothetical protein [Gammaproteobacteria bacterium]|tara:strand:+ start:17991 stop:20240 length:2250 start_codon:yes stop_codon:yes gene_type:complete